MTVQESAQELVHGEYLSQSARTELTSLLASVGKNVTIVLEKPLIAVLDSLFKFSELQAIGVDRVVEWSADTVLDSAECVVYCIRALSHETLPLMTQLAVQIKDKSKQVRHLVFSPVVPKLATNRLEALGVNLSVDFASIRATDAFSFTVLERDTISLNVTEEVFSDFHCRGDPSLLLHVVHALGTIQASFGAGVGHEEVPARDRRIRKINAIGTAAKFVADGFLRLSDERGNDSTETHVGRDEEEMMTGLSRMGGVDSIGGHLLGPNQHDLASVPDGGSEVKLDAEAAIDSVVLIDRRTDLVSLLCSQFTYESLVDEEFGISGRRVKFPASESEIAMTLCNSADPLFAEVRDVSVSVIGQLLSRKANFIAECYKEKDALKSISEIKNFMEKFKVIQAQHASLSNHVALATCVSDFARDPNYLYLLKVEDQIMSLSKPAGKILAKIDAIARKSTYVPLYTLPRVLRLLCLASQTFGPKAVSSAGLSGVLKSLFHVFGFPVIKTLHHLEQCGLLRFHNPAEAAGVMAELMSSGSKWPRIRDEFRLISTEPHDELAEAYSGYVPLSVRLVQLLNTSWKASADKLNLLRGPALEIAQECPVATGGTGNPVVVAVVFIGGVTYGEIAALRKLSVLEGGRRKFLIVTTGISSYSKIIGSM